MKESPCPPRALSSLATKLPTLPCLPLGARSASARASGGEGPLFYQHRIRSRSGSVRPGHRNFAWRRHTLVYRSRRGRGSDLVSVDLGSLLSAGPTGSPYFTGLGGWLCPLLSGRGRLHA